MERMENVLANVARVDIITEGLNPILMRTITAEEVGQEPMVNEGEKQALRSKNRILAQNIFEDLVMGYTLTLKDVVVDPVTFALVDGGTLTWDTDNEHFIYHGPEIGAVINRKKALVDIWTEEKDADGDTLGYHRFRYRNAKGKPVKFSHKDNAFFAPEYTLESRPKLGQSPVSIDSFDALPPDDLTALELIDYTQATAVPPVTGEGEDG